MGAAGKSSWTAFFYACMVFAGGIAVGVLGQRLYSSTLVVARAQPLAPDDWRKRQVADMQTRMKLTPVQVEALDRIYNETRGEWRQVREKYKPEMKAIYDRQVAKTKSMLEPSQIPEYEKILVERERRGKESDSKRH